MNTVTIERDCNAVDILNNRLFILDKSKTVVRGLWMVDWKSEKKDPLIHHPCSRKEMTKRPAGCGRLGRLRDLGT